MKKEFISKALPAIIEGDPKIGVWTDGIGLFSDHHNDNFCKLKEGVMYSVIVERVDPSTTSNHTLSFTPEDAQELRALLQGPPINANKHTIEKYRNALQTYSSFLDVPTLEG